MIYIDKNFLDEKSCKDIIDFYNQNSDKVYQYRDTYPLTLSAISSVTDKIEKICKTLNENSILHTCQIVKWPCGSKMKPHFDPDEDIFAAVVYLNDEYIGGETYFENYKCSPSIGKLVIFSSNKILHQVSEVKEGTRYTLALWFISK